MSVCVSGQVTVTPTTIQQCRKIELSTTVSTLDLNRREYLKLPKIKSIFVSKR